MRSVLNARLFSVIFLLGTFFPSVYTSILLINPSIRSGEMWQILPVSILSFFLSMVTTEADKPKLYQKQLKYVLAPYIKLVGLVGFFFALFILPFIVELIHFLKLVTANFLGTFVTVIAYAVLLILNLKLDKNTHKISSEVTKYHQAKLPELDLSDHASDIAFKYGNDNLFTNRFELIEFLNIDFQRLNYQNVDLLRQSSATIGLLIVDQLLNNLKELNNILRNAHHNLKNGGEIVIVYKELKDFESEFTKSKYILTQNWKKVYFVLRYRLLPKIPYLCFVVSNGSIAYSKAEIWGRLAYTGFDVKKDISYSGLRYIVARKEYQVSENPSPSYYPVIKLNRVGLYGQIIKIHKIRSMSPYSEFIQKKVHDENQLSGTGKFVNDFRITEFGAFFRRYWLDELPQIYDWFRGEIKLVGIRALSQHYFSLYPPDFQEKFIRVKPGIISPIFDEETDGFEEIVRIETEYLDSYLRHPVLTDIKYFFITFRQILSGVRSK